MCNRAVNTKYNIVNEMLISKANTCLPYAEYDDKTMMYAEALLIEYHKGEVLFDTL